MMKIKVGVMGSAEEMESSRKIELQSKLKELAGALARHEAMLLTGATTGLIYEVGKAARDAGVFHLGISPASSLHEHEERYHLPADACDMIVYTGFGLKGRNVVLIRSCDIAIFISGAMGSLNEFTIAHDEGKIIGCLSGTGGVSDEVDYLLKTFSKKTGAEVLQNADPYSLLEACARASTAESKAR